VRSIDLDAIATVRPHPAVAGAMLEWVSDRHAHPGAAHAAGARARRAIEEARAEVAALFDAHPASVVFTSGATEANNHALRGLAALLRGLGHARIAVAAHEHASLLHPARGCTTGDLLVVQCGRDGLLDPGTIADLRPAVIAFGHAHPELGALQPAAALCEAARSAGARTHLDATLSAGRIRTDLSALGRPDTVAVSFHHFGGPMGVGALLVREGIDLPPLIAGGVEEDGRRAGSPNLAGIVGAGVAARLARAELGARERLLREVGDSLAERVLAIDGVRLTGPEPGRRLPGHLSVVVAGVDGEALVCALDERGVLASTGSPCGLEAGLRSASLRAAGYAPDEARSAAVLCVPPVAIPEKAAVDEAARAFAASVVMLRGITGSVAPSGA